MKKIDFLQKARNKHGYKYYYIDLPDKILMKDKIKIRYNDSTYSQSVSKHLMGRCPEKNTPKKTTKEFIKEAKEIWGDKYDYSLTKYKGSLKDIQVIYNGIVYSQRASSHINGLSPEFRSNKEYDFRETIRKNNKNGIDAIKNFLDFYKISYKSPYTVKNLEYDFYLPSKGIILDFKGRHHFEPINQLGGTETLNKIILEDKNKQEYCEDNYINLIEINYKQIKVIYDILKKNLL